MKPKYSKWQKWSRNLLGLVLIGAGTGHLTFARLEFQAQVPTWLPVGQDLVVVLSGIVEAALGLALIFVEKRRTRLGWVAAVFFVLVFPGNISQYVNQYDAFGLDSDAKRLARLFFQPVLVVWALWSTGAWQDWRKK